MAQKNLNDDQMINRTFLLTMLGTVLYVGAVFLFIL